jgi:hypothetical protein
MMHAGRAAGNPGVCCNLVGAVGEMSPHYLYLGLNLSMLHLPTVYRGLNIVNWNVGI